MVPVVCLKHSRVLSSLVSSCQGVIISPVCVACITADVCAPGIAEYQAGLRSGCVTDNGDDVYAHMSYGLVRRQRFIWVDAKCNFVPTSRIRYNKLNFGLEFVCV